MLYNLSRLSLGLPSLTEALIARTYDASRGLFMPVARPAPHRQPATTIAPPQRSSAIATAVPRPVIT